MARTLLFASILCLASSPAVVPFAAKADPRVLTTSELAAVTAGRVIRPPIQINLNSTVQVARATAISTAVCTGCNNATVTAFSNATAFNQSGGTDEPGVLSGGADRAERSGRRAARWPGVVDGLAALVRRPLACGQRCRIALAGEPGSGPRWHATWVRFDASSFIRIRRTKTLTVFSVIWSSCAMILFGLP